MSNRSSLASYKANWCETMQNATMVDIIFYCYIWSINLSDSISDHIKVQLLLEILSMKMSWKLKFHWCHPMKHEWKCIIVWRETLVIGKFGELSAKVRTFGEIKFGELRYGVCLMQLSSGVVWSVYIFYIYITMMSSSLVWNDSLHILYRFNDSRLPWVPIYSYGIILWQMETYFVNEKLTQFTDHGYQEVVDSTPAASWWAHTWEISSNPFVRHSYETL